MQIEYTFIDGLIVLVPKTFEDPRGYFMESYNQKKIEELGFTFDFKQDNEAYSKYGVIRGLHYQVNPKEQTKLVRVVSGKVLDVAVDLRPGSQTFGRHFSIELSSENKKQLLIPKGFAHGYSVLSEGSIFVYKCDEFYSPEHERGINPLDPYLNINWLVADIDKIVSMRDLSLPQFKDIEVHE
jgi:dTDP-4-dehydrorhamnose 3,5-epimerase